MRTVRMSLYLTLGFASYGCPGTIDDASDYEGYQGAQRGDEWPSSDAGLPPTMSGADAGWSAPAMTTPTMWQDASANMAAWDASQAPAWDASTSGRDASAPARDAASPTDAASASACNFRALMQMKCGNAACHGAPAQGTGLDLTSEGLAQRVAGRRGSDGCDDYLLVDPERPAQSALYLKVSGTTCGVRMPIGASLTAEEQACVLSWIEKL